MSIKKHLKNGLEINISADDSVYVPLSFSLELLKGEDQMEHTIVGITHYSSHRTLHLCVFSGGNLVFMQTVDTSLERKVDRAHYELLSSIAYEIYAHSDDNLEVDVDELVRLYFDEKVVAERVLRAAGWTV